VKSNQGRKLSGTNTCFNYDGAYPGPANAPVLSRQVYGTQLPNIPISTLLTTNAALNGLCIVRNYYNSSYNSLQSTLTHKFTHGLGLTVNHVWAHGLDNRDYRYTGFDQWIQLKASQDSDIRSRISITMNYDFPFKVGHGFVNKIVHQWALGAIGIVQTGSPLTFSQTTDQTNQGSGNNYPMVVGNPATPGGSTYNAWFNVNAFAAQPAGTWSGTNLRNILYGPGKWNFDTSLQRVFKPTEKISLQFRLENFDLTNTQTPGNPNPKR
jgi:hypothetical protein